MTSRTFTDEYNALVKKLEELCKQEGIDFYGKQVEDDTRLQEISLNAVEWYDSGCYEDYPSYWQSSRC